MTAEITVSQLYWNPSLMNFFFRSQAEDIFNEVMDRVTIDDKKKAFDYFESLFCDVDDMEEYLYDGDVDEIVDELADAGITVIMTEADDEWNGVDFSDCEDEMRQEEMDLEFD